MNYFSIFTRQFVLRGWLEGDSKRGHPAFCKMLGYSESETLARLILKLFTPDDTESVMGR